MVFKLRDGIEPEQLIHILTNLADQFPDLIERTVKASLDTRKGVLVVENFLFKDETAFKEFRESEVHRNVAALIRELADWQIVDYWE